MGWRKTLMGALVVGAVGFTAGRVFSQDAAKKEMTEEEKMKAFMEMAAPAEENKKLAAMAGTWDCEMTNFEPGKEPTKWKGTSSAASVLNGLYLATEYKGDMGGMPFEGRGFDGYSKEKKKYFTLWADTMGTTPMFLWGTADAAGKTITYDGDTYDCGPMGMMTPRVKITHDDADHYTFEFWAKMNNAPEYGKMMEGKYTRRK
jgi:uncharacterized protein DUF1579